MSSVKNYLTNWARKHPHHTSSSSQNQVLSF
uniref:Putative LOC100574918 [Acyrthosiphon pisum] n=1 Tax=Lepeophtheirus salmonis TaxID=72036 RepID=A0A0K2TXP7_LEPSM